MSNELIYGIHPVNALLERDAARVVKVLVIEEDANSRLQALVDNARERGVSVEIRQRQQLEQMLPDAVHQGVIAEFRDPGPRNEKQLKTDIEYWSDPWLVLVLDSLQDPHNLGACLRSADAMGVNAVIIPKDNSVGLTASARKVAAGAASTVPLYRVTNLVRALAMLQQSGAWVYGAAGEATRVLPDLDFSTRSVVVMGQEGNGLRRLTREACDDLFSIPMLGTISSLNVSVATGITLYEVSRQRAKTG